jgi:SAM-dependent methyltransferase
VSHRIRKDCRLCGGTDLPAVLELAPTPPANEFLPADFDGEQEKFPLYLVQCQACGHVQLPVVIDPERLFRNYVYVSGTSPSFVAHFERYAEAMIREHGLSPGDLVVDIGSNDGTLLRFFQQAGMRVVGIDPAKKIAEQATAAGIETLPTFFDRKTARAIHEQHGPAALVVANNVFAHADDLREIALGVRDLLDPMRGRFVFEVQYLVDLVERTLFDMVYHEHLSYHHLAPLVPFFDSLSMTLVDAEHVDTHGGSIRCTVAPRKNRPQSDRLTGMLKVEQAALAGEPFKRLRERIDEAGKRVIDFIWGERLADRLIDGYGAPAKLTTLCHQFGVTGGHICVVHDDSPWKQGLLTPGMRIPVVAPDFANDKPDSVMIFAWNFADSIAKKLRASGYTGRIVTPLPEFKELP